jgi:hypothetical protein
MHYDLAMAMAEHVYGTARKAREREAQAFFCCPFILDLDHGYSRVVMVYRHVLFEVLVIISKNPKSVCRCWGILPFLSFYNHPRSCNGRVGDEEYTCVFSVAAPTEQPGGETGFIDFASSYTIH